MGGVVLDQLLEHEGHHGGGDPLSGVDVPVDPHRRLPPAATPAHLDTIINEDHDDDDDDDDDDDGDDDYCNNNYNTVEDIDEDNDIMLRKMMITMTMIINMMI